MCIDFKSVLCVAIFMLIFFAGITSDSFVSFMFSVMTFIFYILFLFLI